MDDLYSEIIVDHYKNPRNFGEMDNPTFKGRGANASCGDMVEFYIQGNKKIEKISFQGIGCALSTASSSMLSEKIKGFSFEEVMSMNASDLAEMMGIEISPTRMKCVELPLKTLQSILKNKESLSKNTMNIRHKNIKEAVEILRNGGVIVFPTDTVWGVGASMESKEGIEKLYKIKNREKDKPTAILVGSINQAKRYGDFGDVAWDLATKYWPGALTIIVPANEKINKKILNKNGGVGIRCPKSKVVSELCEGLGGGLVTASANITGEDTPKSLNEISDELISRVDGVIEGDDGGGKSSTVVDCMGESIKILRQGDVWV